MKRVGSLALTSLVFLAMANLDVGNAQAQTRTASSGTSS